jgi:hypothetical protein
MPAPWPWKPPASGPGARQRRQRADRRLPAIRRLRDMIPTLADADLDLLIEGKPARARNCSRG